MATTLIHLIDLLPRATVEAPGPEYTAVQPITIGRETRMCVFEHPPASIEFPALALGSAPVLDVGLGIKQACWDRIRAPVTFTITVRAADGVVMPLLEATLDPRVRATFVPDRLVRMLSRRNDRRWVDRRVSLARLAGQTITLTFTTRTPRGAGSSYCWAGWSDPVVTHEVAVAPVTAMRTTKQPLVVLITSDALRADHLGCYGHPTVKTPNMDALAADGALFPHARTQSPATLGAHASILTGLLPTQHGITAEWGSLPDRLVTLPQFLAARGWHTAMAPSEYELYEADRGMVRLFQQVLPCLAVPAQDGAITTRQVLRWLDNTGDDPRPDRPTFLWIEYFDTHPPATPPAPFRMMYYAGDPSDPRNTYHSEWVGKIRGIEAVAEFEISLELLPAGKADPGLVARLLATARVLRGQDSVGPDLAAHLIAMGGDACMGMGRTDFADWLDTQARRVEEERATPEFLAWLRDILRRLKVAETEIVAWLDGVVDYRYAIAQYMAEVSYLDHHIGTLVAALRAHGLYDDALIVVTSPHGELLAEGDVHFHHHALLEEVLRVPMIIKPPGTSAMGRRGVRPGGVFDSIDLFPTLVDAVGLTVPAGLAGVSRWKHVCDGSDIPPHDSFAVDYLALTFALARPPLVYHKARADYHVSQQWSWTAGEARAYKMSELQTGTTRRDLRQVMPDTQAIEERLTLLMTTHPQF